MSCFCTQTYVHAHLPFAVPMQSSQLQLHTTIYPNCKVCMIAFWYIGVTVVFICVCLQSGDKNVCEEHYPAHVRYPILICDEAEQLNLTSAGTRHKEGVCVRAHLCVHLWEERRAAYTSNNVHLNSALTESYVCIIMYPSSYTGTIQ